MILPTIVSIPKIQLIGYQLPMSFRNNRTFELWSSFMPRKKQISNCIGSDLYCIQQYETDVKFNLDTQFIKWAAVPVKNFDSIPENMDTITIPSGLYAVFTYKGVSSEFVSTFNYIFYEWLPNSIYQLDNRPHFEILGAKYKNNDPSSEEEVYIPIVLKE